MEGAESAINPFDRLPEEIWIEIFGRVPHLSRLHSRCLCSKWNQFLWKQQCCVKPADGVWCLAIGELIHESVPFSFSHPTRLYLQCWALAAPPERTIPLEVRFPPPWTPDSINAGGFRAGGDLAAFFQDSHYWVGNPVHGKWDTIQAPLEFGSSMSNRFELVVLPGSYQIVQFVAVPHVFKSRRKPAQNFVIQVFSSRTRSWRAGPSVDRLRFTCLYDYCVLEKTVYFLGAVAIYLPDPDYQSVEVWGYNLDSDSLSLVVPAAQFCGVVNPFQRFGFSLRLHVSNRHRKVTGSCGSSSSFSQEFSITMVGVRWGDHHQDKLFRLLLNVNQLDPGDMPRFWYIESMVEINDLTSGSPQAAVVADTWGVELVAYYANAMYTPEGSMHPGTTTILCYHRAEQRWVEWHIKGPESIRHQELHDQAIAFHPCACCSQQSIGSHLQVR